MTLETFFRDLKHRKDRTDTRRHTRKCRICKHPQRDAIEHDFLHWRHPHDIVDAYHLSHYSAIYRHAHALGLTARRNENFRSILDILVERAAEAKVTGNTVIRAIRAYSCLNDKGHWTDLPTRVIHESVRKSSAKAAATAAAPSPAPEPENEPEYDVAYEAEREVEHEAENEAENESENAAVNETEPPLLTYEILIANPELENDSTS
jgi:hypothetical protein